MTYPWSDLKFWQSGEFQVVKERLDADIRNDEINPERKSLFKALSATPFAETKVVILGQDPYPDGKYATGLAFSIPRETHPGDFPPSLRVILREYSDDLGYPSPSHGDLSEWAERGVLLWNTIPSCRSGKSLSHDWPDGCWDYLTREIIQRCDEKGVVFAFVGAIAKRHLAGIKNSPTIQVAHPSPRAALKSRTPFSGSRLFSTINAKLVEIGLEPVDWRLDAPAHQEVSVQGSGVGGTVLPNVTGAELPGLDNRAKIQYQKSSFEV